MSTNDGGSAFPRSHAEFEQGDNSQCGMTLLDHYAGQAMLGLLSRGKIDDMALLAEKAWGVASFMIEERGRLK